MVTRINFTANLTNVLNYNEHKVKEISKLKDDNGKSLKRAEFIHSSGFAKDTDKLRFNDKLQHLKKQMSYRPSRQKSVIHMTLNFDPSEKQKLFNEKLIEIADTYMNKLGFAGQPYLVYKHNDAAHPHIHIVSTIIRRDGSAIDTHLIGQKVSEPARKEIEKTFGLVVADDHKVKEEFRLKAVDAQKIVYGKSETKRAITNVLDVVLEKYKFTSLSELNVVLQQYNVVADNGSENSKMNLNKGLVYRVLDENGQKTGAPIKASSLYNTPGLKFLEPLYEKNKIERKPMRARVKNAIEIALSKKNVATIEDLTEALRRDKIQLVTRYTKDGRLYGVTFIDHLKKCVFNGSDVDKGFSAAGISQRLHKQDTTVGVQALQSQRQQPAIQKPAGSGSVPGTSQQQPNRNNNTTPPGSRTEKRTPAKLPQKQNVQAQYSNQQAAGSNTDHGSNDLLNMLTKQEYSLDAVPNALKGKKKKKKKRLHL